MDIPIQTDARVTFAWMRLFESLAKRKTAPTAIKYSLKSSDVSLIKHYYIQIITYLHTVLLFKNDVCIIE